MSNDSIRYVVDAVHQGLVTSVVGYEDPTALAIGRRAKNLGCRLGSSAERVVGVFLIILLTLFQMAPASASTEKVDLPGGSLIGVRDQGGQVISFKGVPYALPPVGEHRWKPAVAGANWSGIRRADRFGPDCIQTSYIDPDLDYKTDFWFWPPSVSSEDCLFLNIWRPDRVDEKYPVMVWLHGGGSIQGSGAQPLYDGTQLAKKGVIVVTINYRLGIFGRFAHPELTDESPTRSSSNYDLSDIIQALTWIKANIVYFGGDPNSVTVFGQSAGGDYASTLLVMGTAEGLFQRAIAQSGSVFSRTYPTLDAAQREGKQFGQSLGAKSLRELRAIAADELQAMASAKGYRPAMVVDGHLIADQPCSLAASGRVAKVPLIVGFADQEYYSTGVLKGIVGPEDYEKKISERFGAEAKVILKLFPKRDWQQATAFLEHSGMSAMESRDLTALGSPGYLYRFSKAQRDNVPAFHTSEVPFVFNNLTASARYSDNMPEPPNDAASLRLANTMSDYWVAFARTGVPESPANPRWEAYRPSHQRLLEFGGDIRMTTLSLKSAVSVCQLIQPIDTH
jgi:para-nitrobenzyl esterase